MMDYAVPIIAAALIPACVTVAIWMFRRPVSFVAAYFAVLPFGSAIAVPIGLPRAFSTISSLMGVAAGIMILWRWISERPTLRVPTLSLPIWLVFAALATASIGWSIRSSATFDSAIVLVSLVGLFAIVTVTPFDISELNLMKAWISVGAGLTGLYALVLAITGNLPTTGTGLARFEITGAGGGEGGDPNITAAALIVPIAIALHEGLDHAHSTRQRLLYLSSATLSGVAVLLTASRGGIIAIALVVLTTLISRRRGVWLLAVIGVLVLPAALLAPSTFIERADNTGTTGRTAIWRIAIDSCPEYCVSGSGMGTFADVHENAFLTLESAEGTQFRYQAHSIWFETLIELGVLGLTLMVLALGITIWDVLRLPVNASGGALAGLIGLLFSSTFLSSLSFKYFWLGLTYAVLVATATKRQSPTFNLPRSRVFSNPTTR